MLNIVKVSSFLCNELARWVLLAEVQMSFHCVDLYCIKWVKCDIYLLHYPISATVLAPIFSAANAPVHLKLNNSQVNVRYCKFFSICWYSKINCPCGTLFSYCGHLHFLIRAFMMSSKWYHIWLFKMLIKVYVHNVFCFHNAL